eukprot:CAMPEP_0181175776 /NCGR_PEP_ID=MMETSP1096-20121128/4263_1 /TAXON_ID=156174 ORGANISM="Chrysochromulina ericina, Strain CCMP281" /NCGR_SAMPLE_ID=MMETSP1096 /ASSEMBLY_ACC=CAM_ASM_000453 /LENGTH=47 /DNA_ID= /DNA_START= /DNA_END= /DNA_ORIENTATION=
MTRDETRDENEIRDATGPTKHNPVGVAKLQGTHYPLGSTKICQQVNQ